MKRILFTALALLFLSGCAASQHAIGRPPIPPTTTVAETDTMSMIVALREHDAAQARHDSLTAALQNRIERMRHEDVTMTDPAPVVDVTPAPREHHKFRIPLPRLEINANPGDVHITSDYNTGQVFAIWHGPVLKYQNQFGGWPPVDDNGWVDLPVSMGGMSFQVNPNGRTQSIVATYDGNIVGTGMTFGIPNYKDNGVHHLYVTVTRAIDDSDDREVIQRKVFHIRVFNYNGN